MTLQYQQCNPQISHLKRSHDSYIKWQPPDNCYIRFNFDGSVKSNHAAATGFVIRNFHGHPIFASSHNIGYSDVLTFKALALRQGLQQALNQGFLHIQVEGDSKIVIDSILQHIPTPWRIQFLVGDITALPKCCTNIYFSHIHCQANFLVDALAQSRHATADASWSHASCCSSSSTARSVRF